MHLDRLLVFMLTAATYTAALPPNFLECTFLPCPILELADN